MKSYKSDFPIFNTFPELVYLDSAATSQKPQSVIDSVMQVYTSMNSNIHRGLYDLSQAATEAFELSRKKIAHFIGASDPCEIIFTSGTTEGINMVAVGWAKSHLHRGDIIVLSDMEHHSNIVPWQRLRDEIGVELYFLPLDDDYRLDYRQTPDSIIKRVKLVTLAQASNVLGTINPIVDIMAFFKSKEADAKLLVDAAQSVPHLPVDVGLLNADFLAFSSHKMLGPSGVGVLYIRKELQSTIDPMVIGSHMISTVTKKRAVWADAPDKFEPGTRNIEGTIGTGAAVDYLKAAGMSNIAAYERDLTGYALNRFKQCGHVRMIGPSSAENRLGVFSFEIDGVHPHDAAEILNRRRVAVRSGHHCAQPLMRSLGVTGTIRASCYTYNTKADIDALFNAIDDVIRVFKV